MKHRTVHKEKDPLDREIKCLVTIVLIAFAVASLMPYLQAHFIDSLIQYADAAQFHIPPDFAGSTTQGGISVTCPQITSPSSATGGVGAGNGAGSGWTSFKQSTTGGCTFSAYVIEDGLFPEEFAQQQSPVPALSYLLTPTTRANSGGCQMFDLDDLTIPGSTNLVDPRLNITATYDSIRNGAILTGQFIRCSFTASYQPQQSSSAAGTYNSRDNQTWYSWGMAEGGFGRPTLLASKSLAVSSIEQKWALPIPANHTSNYWQMQEHPMYSGTYPVISDGFFGIDGDTFTMDSGSTNAQRGEVVLFKAFNKTELSQNVVPIDNLIAYYTFEESSGSLINEAGSVGSGVSFGTAADGSVGGSITRGHNGIIGSSYLFPGLAGGQITLGSSLSQFNFLHNTTAKWTMNFWENSTSASGSGTIIQNNVGTTANRGMDILYSGAGGSSGTSSLITRGVIFTALAGVTSTGTLPNGFWNMVTYTYDYNGGVSTGSNHKVYVNGVLQSSGGLLNTPAFDTNAPVALQMGGFGGLIPYLGKLDEFSIWNDELSTTEITELYNGGSGLSLSTTTGGDLPDIRVQGAIESVGSSSGSHIHIEVKDGNFQAGQTEGLNAIGTLSRKDITEAGNSDDVAYFERNQYMTYMNSTRDTLHSLGVYDLEDPTVGTANNFDISFAPNWSNSTSDIITVFVAVQDNSTTGSMIANVTSIELENKLKYNFTDITDFVFWEPNCAEVVGSDSPQTDGGVPNAYNCNEDVSNGLTQIQNITAGNITSNVLPTPNQVQNVTLAETDSILVDWDHNLVNVTGFRIYRTSTEVNDTESYINGLPSGSAISQPCADSTPLLTPNSYCSQGQAAGGSDLAGRMISDMTWSLRKPSGGSSPTGATFKGVVFNTVIGGGSDFSTVNNSTETYVANTVLAGFSDYSFTFRPPINSTDNNDGVGLFFENWAGGGYEIEAKINGGSYTPKGNTIDAGTTATTWTGYADDFRLDVNEVNQTKLFYNPYLLNSGNLTTSYVDENVTTGNTYFYRVVALNGNIESDGQIFNYTIIPAPGPVTGLTATALNATVSLDWNDATFAQNYSISRNGTYIATSFVSDYIDSAVAQATNYIYSVFARNTSGNGTADTSNVVLTNAVPTAPYNLTAAMGLVIPDLEDVFLNWNAPLDNGTGSPSTGADIIKYQVERKQGLGAFSFLANTTNATSSYEDESVISGANYTWKVRAVNPVGYSPFSNTFSLITTPLMVPNPPTNLTATAISGYKINVDWLAGVGGDPVISYVLQQRHVGFTGFVTIATIPAPTLFYNVTGLLPGNTYDYRVRADNGAGSSAYSNIGQAVTFNVPSAPQTLNAVTFNNTRIDLTWLVPVSVGSGIDNYTIEKETPVGGGFFFEANTTNLFFSSTSLTQNTVYNYRVKAANDIGYGAYSNQDNDRTQGIPDAPINLSYTTNGISTITVDWDSPVYTGGVPLTAYTIEQAQGIGGTFVNAIPNHAVIPSDNTFIGLLQSTNYIYKIAAKNQYGTGSYSANLTAGTFGGPSEPENFLAVFNSTFPYSVNLSWSVPLDDGGEPIQGYIIQRKNLQNVYVQIANVTNSTFSFTDSSLLQLATHVYRIAAFGSVGDFTADQPVTTVVTPHFQTFTIDNFDVFGDVLRQNYTVVIDDCFPACVLTQADIERNGITESNYVVGSSIPLNTPVSFTTYFIIPNTGTQFINTTALVTNLGSNNSNETGVVTTQLQFVVPTLFFNHTRVNNFQDINFTIVRHPIPWSAECTHVISSTFLNPAIGISGTQPNLSLQNIGSYNGLFDANPSLNSYIACYDPVNTQILAFTSFGSGNGTLALTTFTNQLGDFMGVPVPFIFVLFFAAIWTGRSAPTGIIMLAVVIGFLGVLGYFDPLSGSPTQTQSLEAFWGLIVILTLLGVFIGKRFF